MARLLRLTAGSLTEIYSGDKHFTESEARESFLDEHGVEASKVDSFSFDVCTKTELINFARSGSAET